MTMDSLLRMYMPEKHSYVSLIPTIWKYIKGPIKSIHDKLSPIPEGEEYGLHRQAREHLYDTMYSHLEYNNGAELQTPSIKVETPVDVVNKIIKNKLDDLPLHREIEPSPKTQNKIINEGLTDKEIYEENLV
nr:hypothetical protein [Tolivirales sp.]